jgi:hypothetical protein
MEPEAAATEAQGQQELKALQVYGDDATGSIAAFSSHSNFRAAVHMANALSKSTVVPAQYQNKPANCLVAMELASRIGASVIMVMQSLHVIEGRPSWSSAFLIASVNTCGRFSPLRFQTEGVVGKDGWRIRAIAKDLASGDVLEGEWITWEIVKAEGWLGRKGSKWQTIPGQMGRYRAAAFWTRVYAPEISLGMRTVDESEDIGPDTTATASVAVTDLNAAIEAAPEPGTAPATTVNAEVVDERAENSNLVKSVPCKECGAKVGEEHKSACPLRED